MKKVLGLIFNRWVLLVVLLLAALAVIWIVGPMVAIGEWRPLDGSTSRWVFTAVFLGIVALVVGWRLWRAHRGNQKVVEQLMAAPRDTPATPAESADLAAVRERFETALQTLRNARFGAQAGSAPAKPSRWARLTQSFSGRFLYELPWYTIIGAPGSGKTTALRNAGLSFPLADRMGEQAVRGVGGTRNCDWWFTDQAVLIDTAGRFVTQDSDKANDKATWGGFLQLLKKSRPRQPLNGVLVTVSVSDLITKNPAERARHAQDVRARVQELHEQLAVRLPIYLLVTKCDLMAGFGESFASLDKEQRATPWGFTVPLSGRTAQEALGPEFDALLQRLNDGLVDRLQGEPDPQRRARIYGFPNQFASLREALQEFVQQVFSPSPFEADPMLRGVYFVSGTQEGSPIDRVLGAVARRYRLEQAMLPPQQASGRSYFLSRLLTEVVFAEHGIGGTNRRWERRRGAMALAGYIGLGLVALALAGVWAVSWSNNKAYVDTVAARVEVVRKGVQETPNRPTSDLRPVLDALDATRGLADAGGSDGSVPWSLGFGLYQGRKLDSAARAAYERMLTEAVLPRLAIRVEEQLRAVDQPESLYEALKAYLMMYQPEHFEPDALKAHFQADWDARMALELTPQQREAMTRHLDALLALGPTVSPLGQDKALIDATRLRVLTVPFAQRVYDRVRRGGLDASYPEFTVAKAGGANASLVFTRTNNQLLTAGVPGLFTYDGYYKGFQTVVGDVTKKLADEEVWVLDAKPGAAAGPQALLQPDKLVNDVRRLYLNEYAERWKAFIASVRLREIKSISDALERTRFLSGQDSPLVLLMRGMSRETTLLRREGVTGAAEDRLRQATESLKNSLSNKLGVKPSTLGAPAEQLESIVDSQFDGLRRMVTAPEGGKAPIEATIAKLAELQVVLVGVDAAVKGGGTPPSSPVPNQLKADAANAPEPLRSLLETLGSTSSKAALFQQRQSLSAEVRTQIGDLCSSAITGRYPFTANAASQVTLQDFATLFGPGGRFDQMQQKLAPFIDTSTKPWSFRITADGNPLGTDVGTLPQFQRAAEIRETFFAGGATASIRLTITPVEMDPTLKEFTLDVDGQLVRYAHGPQIPQTVQWPGTKGTNLVRVSVQPAGLNGMLYDGPWALNQLFDRVAISAAGAREREKFRATFDIDGRKVGFDISTGSVRNPFNLPALRSFQCPNGL